MWRYWSIGREQPRKVSVAEAEAWREEQLCHARQQAAKTLKQGGSAGMSFTRVSTAARRGRRMDSKLGAKQRVIHI